MKNKFIWYKNSSFPTLIKPISIKYIVAIILNRNLNTWIGRSGKDPWWTQAKYKWWHKITHWHIMSCFVCRVEINKCLPKKNWAAKFGVINDKIMCPNCYDNNNGKVS